MVDPPAFIETFCGFGAKVPLRRLAPLGRPETQFWLPGSVGCTIGHPMEVRVLKLESHINHTMVT